MKKIFITATDTGVGKTFVTALIGQTLKKQRMNVAVFKPISTGCIEKNNKLISLDAMFLKKKIPLKDLSLEEISPIRYKLPLSPLAAQMETKKYFKIKEIFDCFKKIEKKYDCILIEGIGGVKVPIQNKYFVSDLIADFDCPAIIVARSGLGTLNHTLMTIEELKRKKIKILGVIFNQTEPKKKRDISEKTNAKIIEQESGIKVIGQIPYIKDIINSHVEKMLIKHFLYKG